MDMEEASWGYLRVACFLCGYDAHVSRDLHCTAKSPEA